MSLLSSHHLATQEPPLLCLLHCQGGLLHATPGGAGPGQAKPHSAQGSLCIAGGSLGLYISLSFNFSLILSLSFSVCFSLILIFNLSLSLIISLSLTQIEEYNIDTEFYPSGIKNGRTFFRGTQSSELW